jgi:hypothetical protein
MASVVQQRVGALGGRPPNELRQRFTGDLRGSLQAPFQILIYPKALHAHNVSRLSAIVIRISVEYPTVKLSWYLLGEFVG